MFACCSRLVRRLGVVGVIARVRRSAAASGSRRSAIFAATAATATATPATASAASLTAFTPLCVCGTFLTFRARGLLVRTLLLLLALRLLLGVGLLLRTVRWLLRALMRFGACFRCVFAWFAILALLRVAARIG